MLNRVIGSVLLIGLCCAPGCEGDRTPVCNIGQNHFRDGANDLGAVERVEMAYKKGTPGAEITVFFSPFHDSEGTLIEDRQVRWNIDDGEAKAVASAKRIKLTRDHEESKVFPVSVTNADDR